MSKKITDKDVLKSIEILKEYCDSLGDNCTNCIIYKTYRECDICNWNIGDLKPYIEELDTNTEDTEEIKTEILSDDTDTINEQSKTYEDGLKDMYKYIQKLYIDISIDDLIKIFNLKYESFNSVGGVLNHIFRNYNSNEIIEKVKEWEESQIQVGDEIISTISTAKGIITYIYDINKEVCGFGFDKKACILWEDGTCEETTEVDDLKKTGRNLKQELDNMLKNISIKEGEDKS